jgi:iron complex transport system permease protein
VLAGLALVALGCVALFLTWDVKAPWSFVLPFRGRKLWGLVLCAHAVAVSTVLFQTVTGNRILTPSIMGFDALFALIQTLFVFLLGGLAFVTLPAELRFTVNAAVMIVAALLLFRLLFTRNARSLHLLVLVGIVFGVLFRSLSGLMQRLINPNDFAVLQDVMFASFNSIEPTLLGVATFGLAGASLAVLPLLARLDVLLLGREPAIGLGVDHRRTVSLVLAIVAVMVSISTALVGPVLFLGLLVANLAYLLMPDHRHAAVLPAAILLSVVALVGGQAILEHAFGYDTALAVIIEFAGGILFLALLLKGLSR